MEGENWPLKAVLDSTHVLCICALYTLKKNEDILYKGQQNQMPLCHTVTWANQTLTITSTLL